MVKIKTCPKCKEEMVLVGDLIFERFLLQQIDDIVIPNPDFIGADFTEVSDCDKIKNIEFECYNCGHKEEYNGQTS